jgi:hypothetical protein
LRLGPNAPKGFYTVLPAPGQPPVRQNVNAATRDDARPAMEIVDLRTGAESVAAIAPENPIFSMFGTQRINIPPRQLVVDSKGNTYSITLSGPTIVPVTLTGVPPRPVITGGSREIVNSNDGTPNFRPGSFITINGTNLANAATADLVPLPTVLGGSCVILSEAPLPLMNAASSDPIVVTVQR